MPEAGQGAVASVPVDGDTATSSGAAEQGRRLAWAWGTALFCLTVIVLWFLYLHVSRTQRVESDGASNALQAWDMLHGNLLLRGWTVTDVSFYTTELPEYMLVEAIRGLNADVLHAAAALSYALLVPLAAILAKGRATGREALFRMLIAAGIMLAPEPGAGVFIVLFQPDHIGTGVPLLLTWLVLERAPRRWYAPVAIGLMLTWVGIADQVVIITGVVPLVLVCGVRALRTWHGSMSWRAMPRQAWRPAGLRAVWYEASLAVAAVLSVPLASAFVKAIHALGGYTILPVATQLASPSAIPLHIRLATDGVLGLYGANFQGPPTGVGLFFAILHLIGVALAIWALWLALRRFFRDDDLISAVLAVGIVLNIVAYLFSGKPTAYWSVREMAWILPAGVVLAGRMLGPLLAGSRPAERFRSPFQGGLRSTLTAALAVVLACYLAALGWAATRPPVPGVGQALQAWLRARNLTYGLAEYGLASSTTLASGNTVRIRPVVTEPTRLDPGPHEYNTTWYDPSKYDANFVVLLSTPAALDWMSAAQAIAAFGPPAHEYHFKLYLIMTWNKNLLTQLGPPAPD
ncbi:MAG TPA: hypothetical protein VN969_21835 [Streptosporangiaceae bacterium]|nr:hypothetical protein [Streptosporangiaceae bacterium]